MTSLDLSINNSLFWTNILLHWSCGANCDLRAVFIDLTFTSLNLSLVKGTISYSKILSEVEANYLRTEFIDLTSTSLKSRLSQIFEYKIVPLTRLKLSEVKVIYEYGLVLHMLLYTTR